jgi:hypothetical protein
MNNQIGSAAMLSVLRTVAEQAGCSSVDADEAFEILKTNGVQVCSLLVLRRAV